MCSASLEHSKITDMAGKKEDDNTSNHKKKPLIFLSSRGVEENATPVGGLGAAVKGLLELEGGHWFRIEKHKTKEGEQKTESPDGIFTKTAKWKSSDVYMHTIYVPEDEYKAWYHHINKAPWPVNHDRPDYARIKEGEQEAHDRVQKAVSREIAKTLENTIHQEDLNGATMCVEDSHFAQLLTKGGLREMLSAPLSFKFFLHTPLPTQTMRPRTSLENFLKTGRIFRSVSDYFEDVAAKPKHHGFTQLPVTPQDTLEELKKAKPDVYEAYMGFIQGMGAFDQVAFQTAQDAKTFVKLLGLETDSEFRAFEGVKISYQGREIEIMHAPISVSTAALQKKIDDALGEDYEKLEMQEKWNRLYGALSERGKWMADQLDDDVETIIYSGAERGDFSKGAVERLRSYYNHLEENPQDVGKIQVMQICIPTRGLEEYADIQNEVEKLARIINEEFGSEDFKPVILFTGKGYEDQSIPNTDAILLNRVTRIFGGRERMGLTAIGAIRDGKNLTVGEGFVGQDPDLPSIVAVPNKIGATPDFEGRCLSYDPETEDAFTSVLKKSRAVYRSPNGPSALRTMHANAMAFLRNNDISKWINGRLGRLNARGNMPEHAPQPGLDAG